MAHGHAKRRTVQCINLIRVKNQSGQTTSLHALGYYHNHKRKKSHILSKTLFILKQHIVFAFVYSIDKKELSYT